MNSKSYEDKAVKSMVWKFVEGLSSQLVAFIVSIVLARILCPDDYSVVGIVTIFFSIAEVLISGGFSSALIREKNADEKDYSSVLWISIIVSILTYVCLFLCAPSIANVYNQPILIPMLRIMALILPINAIKSIWSAKVSASLEFRVFFYSNIFSIVISAVVGIVMALNNFGAWALVAQQMCNSVVGTFILIMNTRIKIVFQISLNKTKKLFGYGWKVFVSSLIGKIYTEVNPLVVGLKFSPADLSYYAKGNSFPSKISSITNSTFSSVLFSLLSKYQDDKNTLLIRTRQFIRYATYLVFPSMLGLFAVADSFVSVLLTDKWIPIVPFIRIFCVSQMFDMIHSGNCEAIKAMGRSDVFLKMEFIKKTLYFLTIGLFVWFSDSAIALASSMLVCTAIAIIVNSIPNLFLMDYRIKFQIFDLLPNLVISVVMCLGVLFIGLLPINNLLRLLVQVCAGVVLYVLLSLVTRNSSFNFYVSMFKKIKRKKQK